MTKIRPAAPADLPIIVELCALHAAYEKSYYDPEGKEAALAETLFADVPAAYCLLAEQEGKIIGYATYTKQFSTWDANFYVYLDCLYLREAARGKGIGEQLMQRVRREAGKMDCGLVQWQTPDFNTRAIKFYRRIGAVSKEKERFFWKVLQ